MQFAKHQSFHIREGWLRKGMRAILRNPGIFLEKNASDELGIGKNMVSSLRYWMQATGIAKEEYQMLNGVRRCCQQLTPFGEIISKFDPYFEEEVTLFTVHASLVGNSEMATACYWLFNCCPQREFDKVSFLTSLEDYTARHQEKEVAFSSLEKDFSCILRTYLPAEEDNETHVRRSPKSLTDCPLSTLGLITKIDKDKYLLNPPDMEQLDPILILYVLLSQQKQRRPEQLTVNLYDALTEPGNVGRIFNLNAVLLSELLMRLSSEYDKEFLRLERTAGLDSLVFHTLIHPHDALIAYYNRRGNDNFGL